MKKFLGIILGIFIVLSLTSCRHKLTCDDSTVQTLTKQLFVKYKLIPIALSAQYENIFMLSKDYDDSLIQSCKQDPNQDFCPKFMSFYNKIYNFYYINANDNVKLQNFFLDSKDENSKTITCHAEIYLKVLDGSEFKDMGMIYYKAQESTDGNEVEVTLTDFQLK